MSSRLFDAELRTVAQSMASMNNAQLNTIDASNADLAVQQWNAEKLILRTTNTPESAISPFKEGYSDQNFNAQRWRVYASQNNTADKWVFVAQPLNTRFELTEQMMIAAMTPLFFSIPFLAVAIFLLVTYGLAPLRELTKQLAGRKEHDFSTITLSRTPQELVPAVETLNRLLSRLQSAYEREKQFASHAAHELRTPLSVLKVNLHNLQQIADSSQEDIHQLQLDTDRMIHVVNQILLLSRTNPELVKEDFEYCDPYAIAQDVISDIYPKIDEKNQNIELNGCSFNFKANRFALYTLLQNVIANANKYAPLSGDLSVDISYEQNTLRIIVEDSGTGMPQADIVLATQRFFRGQQHTNSKIEGSGLGLSIVEQIVRMHSGNMTLSKSAMGGLRVEIELCSQ
ncbi:sensor histidine kinase [Aliiglaciecola litoralis]